MEVPLHQGVNLGVPGSLVTRAAIFGTALISVPRFTRPLKEDTAILTQLRDPCHTQNAQGFLALGPCSAAHRA